MTITPDELRRMAEWSATPSTQGDALRAAADRIEQLEAEVRDWEQAIKEMQL